jgi:transposase InsO family protein
MRAYFEDVPYQTLQRFRARFQRVLQRRHRVLGWELEWPRPGAVWSIDFFALLTPQPDGTTHALVVRDVGSPCILAVVPMHYENASGTVRCLRELFLRWGPPLVIKSDSGPAFIAGSFAALLDEFGVQHLRSPVRTPQYNGAVERIVRELREAIHLNSCYAGREGEVALDDLEAARFELNHTPRDGADLTPLELWFRRPPITPQERVALAATYIRLQLEAGMHPRLAKGEQLVIQRRCLRDAMVDHGFLIIKEIRIVPRQAKSRAVRQQVGKFLRELIAAAQGARDEVLRAVRFLVEWVHAGVLPLDLSRWYDALQNLGSGATHDRSHVPSETHPVTGMTIQ